MLTDEVVFVTVTLRLGDFFLTRKSKRQAVTNFNAYMSYDRSFKMYNT